MLWCWTIVVFLFFSISSSKLPPYILPIFPALEAKGIPTVGTGFALPESAVHSPNERMRVEDIPRAIEAAQELFRSWGALG